MITGIVMASGFGRRFGENKLLTPFQGQPLFVHGLSTIVSADLDRVVVVTQHKEIADYCKQKGIDYRLNFQADKGQSQSVILGVEHAAPDSDFMFFVADQPGITRQAIATLVAHFRRHPTAIIQPVVDGRPSSPTIFPRDLRSQLLEISGDQGGRTVLQANRHRVVQVPLTTDAGLFDVDTPADLEKLT